jgi:DNA-binding LytR/AlgR family response regulator
VRPPKAILAEDETLLRDELRARIGALWPELVIAGEASTGTEALRLLDEHAPDVMFLDIQMPGMTGIEVALQAQGRCHIVFITAYDTHAIAAFEVGALDYLRKPVDGERLATALRRVKERLGSPPPQLESLISHLLRETAPRSYLRWINASIGRVVRLITVDEILYFQADGKYTRLVTADAEALIQKPLFELQAELDPSSFWQIHRSTLVNASAIAEVTHDLRGHVVLRLKHRPETLRVSETHQQRFRSM